MDRVKSKSNVHEFTGLLSTQTQSRVYETYKNVVTGMDSLRTADAFPVVASLSQATEWIAACQDQRFTTKTRKFLSVWTVVRLTECIANLIEWNTWRRFYFVLLHHWLKKEIFSLKKFCQIQFAKNKKVTIFPFLALALCKSKYTFIQADSTALLLIRPLSCPLVGTMTSLTLRHRKILTNALRKFGNRQA